MKLTDLDPVWVTYGAATHRRFSDSHSHVDYHADSDGYIDVPDSALDVTNADGILFLCPTCFQKNGGSVGTESVICWFVGRSIPPDATPGPGRWHAVGTSFDDLTLQPSVNVDHEHWHGFITNGQVTP